MEENKLIVRHILEAIWNQKNPTVVAEYFASDYLGHSANEMHGLGGIKQWAEAIFRAFPDSLYAIQDQVAEGDKVVTRWVACGLHAGEFDGLPPTGKMVTITGIDIFRIANRKIFEGWMVADIRSKKHEEVKL